MRKYQTTEAQERLTQKLRAAFRPAKIPRNIWEMSLRQDKRMLQARGEVYNPSLEEYIQERVQHERAETDEAVQGFVTAIARADETASQYQGDYSTSTAPLKAALECFFEDHGGAYGFIMATKPFVNTRVAKRALCVIRRRLDTIPSAGKDVDWYSNPGAGSSIEFLKYFVGTARPRR